VKEATRQVVSGAIYRFKVVFQVGTAETTCDFEVWEQAWIENGREVKVNCDNEKKYKLKQQPLAQRKKKTKRDTLVGAPAEIDTEDEDIHKLLSANLKRLVTGSDATLELVSVDKITRQIVSGLSYKVKGSFRAGDEEPKKCTVDIWTRSWIDGEDATQIKADCEDGVRLKTKRVKRSLHRPMPGRERHHVHHEIKNKPVDVVKSEILFGHYIKKYNRRYANDLEHEKRLHIFKKNLHKIDLLNKHEQGTAKYGITEFADMTPKEYLRKTGFLMRENENELRNPVADIPDIKDLPEEFDWREKNAVTSVKDQGNCGSCWR